jgi:hypothetical protein
MSAQFAAYLWYSSRQREGPPDERKAVRYAKAHWPAFLPSAHEGIGRLLLRVAEVEGRAARPQRRPPAARQSRLAAAD